MGSTTAPDGRKLNNNPTSFPASPSSQPDHKSHPDTDSATNGPESVAPPAIALSVRRTNSILGVLVSARIDHAPKSSAEGRHHGDDAPVRGKILDAPDDGDEDRG